MKRRRVIDRSNSNDAMQDCDSELMIKKNKPFTDGTAVLPKCNSISPRLELTQSPKDDVVCTPDITMFGDMDNAEPPPSPIRHTASAMNHTTPQPQSLAVYQRNQSTPITVVGPQSVAYSLDLSAKHAYHFVDGFTIDLHEASRMDNFQVTKHNMPAEIQESHKGSIHAVPVVPHIIPPPTAVLCNVPELQQDLISGNTMHNQQQQQIWYLERQLLEQIQHQKFQKQQFEQHQLQQKKRHEKRLEQLSQKHKQETQHFQQKLQIAQIQLKNTASLQMQTYSKDALGQARMGLQTQIFTTQEVCQHTISKLNTLMSSNAYTKVRSYNDVKDLHIHVSYLYKYVMEQFRNLYEFNQDDMKKLDIAKDAVNSLADRQANYKSDDDDLKIVENAQVLIDLDSDSETETIDHIKIQHKPAGTAALSSSISIPATQTDSSLNQENVDAVEPAIVCITEDSDCDTELPIPPILGESEDIPNELDITIDSMLNNKAILQVQTLEDIPSLTSTISSDNFDTFGSPSSEKEQDIIHNDHTKSTKSTRDDASTPKVENQSSNIILMETSVPDTQDRDQFIGVDPNNTDESNNNITESEPKNKNLPNDVLLDDADESINNISEPAVSDFESKDQINGVNLDDVVTKIIPELAVPNFESKYQTNNFDQKNAEESIIILTEHSVPDPENKNQRNDVSLDDPNESIIDLMKQSISDLENMDQSKISNLDNADESINIIPEPVVPDTKRTDLEDTDESINIIPEPAVSDSEIRYWSMDVDLDMSNRILKETSVSKSGSKIQSNSSSLYDADESMNIITEPSVDADYINLTEPTVPDSENRDKFKGVIPNDSDESINNITELSESNTEIQNQSLADPMEPSMSDLKNKSDNVDNADESINFILDHAQPNLESKNLTDDVDLDIADMSNRILSERSVSDFEQPTVVLDVADESANNIAESSMSDLMNINQPKDVDLDDSNKCVINPVVPVLENTTQTKGVDRDDANDPIIVPVEHSDVTNMGSDLAKSLRTKEKSGNYAFSSLHSDDKGSEDGMDVKYADPHKLEPFEEPNLIAEQIKYVEICDAASNDDDQQSTFYESCDDEMVDLTEENIIDLCEDEMNEKIADVAMSNQLNSDDIDTLDFFEDANSN